MSNQVCAAVRIKKWIELSKLLQFHINWILWKSSESKAWKPQSSSLIQSRWKEMIHERWEDFHVEKNPLSVWQQAPKSQETQESVFIHQQHISCRTFSVTLPQSWNLVIIVNNSHICQKYLQLLFKKCFSRNVKDQKVKVFCVVLIINWT